MRTHVRLNRQGFRDIDHALKADPGVRRLLVVGDSIAFGWGVPDPKDRFGVWIGRENPVGELRAFSILTGTFALEGRTGTLAVLGPRRMSYQRAFHGIDILREALGEAPDVFVS